MLTRPRAEGGAQAPSTPLATPLQYTMKLYYPKVKHPPGLIQQYPWPILKGAYFEYLLCAYINISLTYYRFLRQCTSTRLQLYTQFALVLSSLICTLPSSLWLISIPDAVCMQGMSSTSLNLVTKVYKHVLWDLATCMLVC